MPMVLQFVLLLEEGYVLVWMSLVLLGKRTSFFDLCTSELTFDSSFDEKVQGGYWKIQYPPKMPSDNSFEVMKNFEKLQIITEM